MILFELSEFGIFWINIDVFQAAKRSDDDADDLTLMDTDVAKKEAKALEIDDKDIDEDSAWALETLGWFFI